jgi:hypothetical protein
VKEPTKEQLRVAIAEAMGYTKPEFQPFKEVQWFSPKGMSTLFSQLPNYPESLDDMHEAEKVLTDTQLENYGYWLMVLVSPNTGYGTKETAIYAHATAHQRAVAFCRVVRPDLFE